MKISLIILFLVPTLSFSSTNFPNCRIESLTKNPADRALEQGANKDKLCSDASYQLSLEKGYIPNSPLLLKVISREMYAVHMVYRFSNEEGETISGKASEFWYPGDSYFVVY